MRRLILVLPVAAVAGCGGDTLALEGTLTDGTTASAVWVAGNPDRTEIVDGAFRIVGVPREHADLLFETDKGEVRMSLRDLPRADPGRLEEIWFREGLAFPGRVEFGQNNPVVVNGLRMASPERLPRNLEVTGTVLSASGDGRSLLVRPVERKLPDLQVSITPGSIVRTDDGDPVERPGLEFGDTVRLTGVTREGLVLVSELSVPRRSATRGRGRS